MISTPACDSLRGFIEDFANVFGAYDDFTHGRGFNASATKTLIVTYSSRVDLSRVFYRQISYTEPPIVTTMQSGLVALLTWPVARAVSSIIQVDRIATPIAVFIFWPPFFFRDSFYIRFPAWTDRQVDVDRYSRGCFPTRYRRGDPLRQKTPGPFCEFVSCHNPGMCIRHASAPRFALATITRRAYVTPSAPSNVVLSAGWFAWRGVYGW